MSTDIVEKLRERPIGRFQIVTVAICLVLNMLDGYDVLAMSFAAPPLREAWKLPPEQLGLLLSSGLFGMTIGSIFISPLSDRFGRRPVILLCVIDMMLGMGLSAFAPDVPTLIALRIMTGLGLGGLLASMNTLVAEYTPDKHRDMAVSLMIVGYPLGAAIGGIAAVGLIGEFGWRAVFVFGGVVAAILLPLVYWLLPESIELLLLRRPKNALTKVNAILKRLGEPAIAELPPAPPVEALRGGALELIGPEMRRGTLLICAGFFMVFMANLFVLSWTPTILRDMGLSMSGAISGSLLMHCGAAAGGIAVGVFATRLGIRLIAPTFMVLLFVMVMIFAILPGPVWLSLAVSVMIGFFGNGSSTTLYAIAPRVFPARLRATGTGLAIGCGRLGGIVSPYVAGLLIGLGWERGLYSFVLCLPLLLSAALVPLIREIGRGRPRRNVVVPGESAASL